MIEYILGIFVLCAWYFQRKTLQSKMSSIPLLEDVSPVLEVSPSISIVIAVRDESKKLHATLSRLSQLIYPNLQIVVVNDRSTDDTGQVIHEFMQKDSRFESAEVVSLPPDWLGKCNALRVGAQLSKNEYLLFMDCDVEIADTALERVMAILLRTKAAHLSVLPSMNSQGMVIEAITSFFVVIIHSFQKYWQTNDPSSKIALGVGAFNLVSRKAYDAIGGHRPLKLEVIDDIGLAYLVKKYGFITVFTHTRSLVRMEWIEGWDSSISIVEKNAFAGFGFSLMSVAWRMPLFLLITLTPWVGLVFGDVIFKMFMIATLYQMYKCYGSFRNIFDKNSFFLMPVAICSNTIGVLRSVYLTRKQGGIYWRGTFYKLSDLKSGMVFPRFP